eukprot:scaffold36187_cov135-Isochrysis_galbana.AAC.5
MTKSTEGMSNPRAATSVAIRMLRSPALNLFSAASRLGCANCPCNGTAPKPSARSVRARRCAFAHVDTKTMAVLPASSLST